MSILCYRSKIISNINTHHLWVACIYIQWNCLLVYQESKHLKNNLKSKEHFNLTKFSFNNKKYLVFKCEFYIFTTIFQRSTFLGDISERITFLLIFMQHCFSNLNQLFGECFGRAWYESREFQWNSWDRDLDVCTETMLLKASLY